VLEFPSGFIEQAADRFGLAHHDSEPGARLVTKAAAVTWIEASGAG